MKKLYRIQFSADGRTWETVDRTHSEREAWYLYREYCLAHGASKTRLVTKGDEVLS